MASEQEIDLYMQTFADLNEQIAKMEEEHKKGERMLKSEIGPRVAQINIIQRMLIKQNKAMIEQLSRMNNIFGGKASE
jgi:hypothetical protein